MKSKEEILNKIIEDLPIQEFRGQMTKDEWYGWFEEAFNKGCAQALQLQQTGVSGRSEQLCGNLDENYNCKNMCLTHCIDGNKFYK